MPQQSVAAGSQRRTASMGAFLTNAPLGHNPFKTPMFTGPESLLKWLLLCLSISISSSLGQGMLVVKYPKAVQEKQEGEALTLNCTVDYIKNECEDVHAGWCKLNQNGSCTELTDTRGYLIQVSEASKNKAGRYRLVTLSFDRLILGDEGTFQCNAECGGNGRSARGNLIKLSVKKADPKRNPVKNSGIRRVEAIPIALHFLFLFTFSTLCLC